MIRHFLLITLLGLFVQTAHGAVALVYNGSGTCAEDCAKAAAQVALRAGLKVRYVNENWSNPNLFDDAVVWIQPGGDAIQVAHTLTLAQREKIREFVGLGGGYVGFCAGAFFSDTWVDEGDTIHGLGLIPVETEDYGTKEAAIVPVNWLGVTRYLYLEEGAYFKVYDTSPVKVLGQYADGKVAAILARFLKGRVAVAGVHPEAPPSWKTGLVDPDGPDYDLAIQMIRWAATRKNN
jgi:glutamine amidotransferase-like uncharacterized protein